MIEIIPEIVEDAVVCNVIGSCTRHGECETCKDMVIGIHNWLVATDQKYLLIDFQDEKDVCACMLEELLQLRKRMNMPFVFSGMMEKAKQTLISLDYRAEATVFPIPEDALDILKNTLEVESLLINIEEISFGKPVTLIRSRYALRADDDEIEEALPEIDDEEEEERETAF